MHLVLGSERKKVWNPVFTIGAISFVLSMIFRGFLNAYFAVIPLGASTIVLFAGVWLLSANGIAVFDKNQSKCFIVYKHLGYIQKVYSHSLTSFDKALLIDTANGKSALRLIKDDGMVVKIATFRDRNLLHSTSLEIASFLRIPLNEKLPSSY